MSAPSMQAIVQTAYGEGDVLRPSTIERPEPGPRQVLVRVRAAGVSQGDWHLTTGRPYMIRVMGFGLCRPKNTVPGMDLAGTVEATGADVTRFAVGDDVVGVTTSAWAEFAVVDETQLVAMPPALDFEHAVALGDSAMTAREAVHDVAKIEAGQDVLVIGASGGVGGYATQLATARGAKVTGVASAAKADHVLSLGATKVIDYRTAEITDDGTLYDVILDIAGNRPLRLLRKALRPEGTLVIVGGEGGGPVFGGIDRLLRALATDPFTKQTITGFVSTKRTHEELAKIFELVERGALRPVVDRVRPLAEASAALADMREGRLKGKIVLRT